MGFVKNKEDVYILNINQKFYSQQHNSWNYYKYGILGELEDTKMKLRVKVVIGTWMGFKDCQI